MPRPPSPRRCRCAGWSGYGPRWPWNSLALVAGGVGRGVSHADIFLGHLAVDDSVGPELHRSLTIPVLAGADQHVVCARLARPADVGAAGVGLGGGVRVVDHHRLLLVGPHLLVETQQLTGVELVERRRP